MRLFGNARIFGQRGAPKSVSSAKARPGDQPPAGVMRASPIRAGAPLAV
jgi:hypothetical protein